MSGLQLKNLLTPSKTVETEFPGYDGFNLQLSFLSRETLVNIRKKATKTTFKNGKVHEATDENLFLKLYTDAAIKGWSGLKISYLQELVPIEYDGDLDLELEYSPEDALSLMQNSSTFDAFVSDTVTTLANFTKSRKQTSG
jgi:hypothetical protein